MGFTFNVEDFLKIVAQIAPIILSFTPYAAYNTAIVAGITAAEQIPGLTGSEKLATATVAVQQAHPEAPTDVANSISKVVNAANFIQKV